MNIKYIAPFLDYSGYGEAARNNILALRSVGVNISTSIPSFVSERIDVGQGGKVATTCQEKQLD